MSVSLLLGTVVAVGSLISMRGRLDTADLAGGSLSVPTILVSCVDPLAIAFEIAAIALVVSDARQFGPLHHRLAWAAVAFYLLWAVANLLGFLPLSLLSMRNGSLETALAGQWIKAGAALLAYTVPALLVFGLGDRTTRIVIALGWLISTIGNFGTLVLTIPAISLRSIVAGGQTLYAVHLNVDYTGGAYPLLLALGYLGGACYMAVYLALGWQHTRARRPEQAVPA
jgi:hypothetical protein